MTDATMNTRCSAAPAAAIQAKPTRTHFLVTLVTILTPAWTWLKRASMVRRQRLALLKLNESQLNDIGLSREDAHREALRPFWDLP